jgi:hypothetical protein
MLVPYEGRGPKMFGLPGAEAGEGIVADGEIVGRNVLEEVAEASVFFLPLAAWARFSRSVVKAVRATHPDAADRPSRWKARICSTAPSGGGRRGD